MTGKNVFGIFLIAGVLLAGSARAEGNPDEGAREPGFGTGERTE